MVLTSVTIVLSNFVVSQVHLLHCLVLLLIALTACAMSSVDWINAQLMLQMLHLSCLPLCVHSRNNKVRQGWWLWGHSRLILKAQKVRLRLRWLSTFTEVEGSDPADRQVFVLSQRQLYKQLDSSLAYFLIQDCLRLDFNILRHMMILRSERLISQVNSGYYSESDIKTNLLQAMDLKMTPTQ